MAPRLPLARAVLSAAAPSAFTLIPAAVAFIVAYSLSPSEATTGFYSAASSLIPVLLLTLAVQARLFDLSSLLGPRIVRLPGGFAVPLTGAGRMILNAVPRIVVTVSALAVLGSAEFMALHPLATGVPDDGNPRSIYGALAGGLAAIAVLSTLPNLGAPEPTDSEQASAAGQPASLERHDDPAN